ncbi:TIGR04086 family membrane protein [Ornithinibacillus halophilus]|uniref:Putative membrane protein, TIGR04086 family n=1 Tax=Ornithinibacillus halophilus TaxID=930117 RepID=A0A1M5DGG2_9BACI|nr:TIGR04086 family membrane protein [Ornithinibacillus halophilus]SHF66057.1 putative membrane protein, TIGR04086 family [Ornithinibacillus halophilus]
MRQQQIIALMYGWIVVLALIFLSSLSLALLLKFSTFNEPTLTWVALVIGLIVLFLGGMIAGIKGKAKGWIIGAFTGLGFTLFVFLVQFLGYGESFNAQQSIHHLFYILSAVLGGVVGVNVVSGEES